MLTRNSSHKSLGSKSSLNREETQGSPCDWKAGGLSCLVSSKECILKTGTSPLILECDNHLGKRAKFYELKNTGEISLFCSDCAFELASKETQIIQLDKEASLRNFSLLQNILRVP